MLAEIAVHVCFEHKFDHFEHSLGHSLDYVVPDRRVEHNLVEHKGPVEHIDLVIRPPDIHPSGIQSPEKTHNYHIVRRQVGPQAYKGLTRELQVQQAQEFDLHYPRNQHQHRP